MLGQASVQSFATNYAKFEIHAANWAVANERLKLVYLVSQNDSLILEIVGRREPNSILVRRHLALGGGGFGESEWLRNENDHYRPLLD